MPDHVQRLSLTTGQSMPGSTNAWPQNAHGHMMPGRRPSRAGTCHALRHPAPHHWACTTPASPSTQCFYIRIAAVENTATGRVRASPRHCGGAPFLCPVSALSLCRPPSPPAPPSHGSASARYGDQLSMVTARGNCARSLVSEGWALLSQAVLPGLNVGQCNRVRASRAPPRSCNPCQAGGRPKPKEEGCQSCRRPAPHSLTSSRPMRKRRISLVPAPISYSLASRSSRPVGYSLM